MSTTNSAIRHLKPIQIARSGVFDKFDVHSSMVQCIDQGNIDFQQDVNEFKDLTIYTQRKLKILVANDDEFQLLIVSTMLEKLQYVDKVDKASNGQEAIDMVKRSEYDCTKTPYDIVFLDLNMPILDGYETCK